MKKILIFGGSKKKMAELVSALEQKGVSAHHASVKDLEMTISKSRTNFAVKNCSLDTVDAIFVYGITKKGPRYSSYESFVLFSDFLRFMKRKYGCKIFDAVLLAHPRMDKVFTGILLAQYGVAYPNSQLLYTTRTMMKLQLPIAVKPPSGSKGNGVLKLTTIEEFNTAKKSCVFPLLAQEWIENDGDYRLLVLGKKVIAQVYRRGNTHINNLSAGSEGVRVQLDRKQVNLAIRCAKIMKYDFCGVDLIQDKHTKQWYVLEVNRAPQFLKTQAIAGVDVTEKLAEYLAKKCR